MLVGSRMEDIIRAEGLENMLHAGAAADRGHHYLAGDMGEFPGHHQTHIVLGSFGLVYEHHALRTGGRHLLHDFQADGTGGTRDEHALSGQLLGDGLHVHANL